VKFGALIALMLVHGLSRNKYLVAVSALAVAAYLVFGLYASFRNPNVTRGKWKLITVAFTLLYLFGRAILVWFS
jgi:hypothetical protein